MKNYFWLGLFAVLLTSACPNEVPEPEEETPAAQEQEQETADQDAGVAAPDDDQTADAGQQAPATETDAGTNDQGSSEGGAGDAGAPAAEALDAGHDAEDATATDAGNESGFPRMTFNLWEDTSIGSDGAGDGGVFNDDTITPFAPPAFTCRSGFDRCPGMITAGENKPFTCCHSNLEECQSGDDYAFCTPADDTECSVLYGEKYSEECSGSAYNTCCAKDEACKTTWNGRAYCVKNCPSNTTECNGWFDDVTDCCLGEEGEDFECEKVNGFHQCVYKDETACPAATIYCPGQTLSLCCPEGTVQQQRIGRRRLHGRRWGQLQRRHPLR